MSYATGLNKAITKALRVGEGAPSMSTRYNSPEALLRLEEKMGRWKGEQRGVLERRKTGWFGRWYEYIEREGAIVYAQVTRKLAGADANKGEAQAELAARLAVANGPAAVKQNIATLAQFVDIRFRPGHLEYLERSTQIQYDSLLRNHILPPLGEQRMRDITRPLVQLWVNGLVKKDLSPQTVRTCHAVLGAVFRHADEQGLWRGELPTLRVKLPKLQRVRDTRALTEEQVTAILANLQEPAHTLALTLALTGMRIGEALALDWRHVNLGDEPRILGREVLGPRAIAVRRNYVAGAMKDSPKTPAGCRNVPIVPSLWVALFAIRQEEGLVFRNRAGGPLDGHNIANRALKAACAAAGLPRMGFHVFRHTLATLAQQKGMSVAEAGQVLGHAATAVTLRYTHGSVDRARDVLAELKIGGKVQ